MSVIKEITQLLKDYTSKVLDKKEVRAFLQSITEEERELVTTGVEQMKVCTKSGLETMGVSIIEIMSIEDKDAREEKAEEVSAMLMAGGCDAIVLHELFKVLDIPIPRAVKAISVLEALRERMKGNLDESSPKPTNKKASTFNNSVLKDLTEKFNKN